MADHWGKGGQFSGRKATGKSVASNQGSAKGKESFGAKVVEHIQIDSSSDSEFEGFVEETSPTSNANGSALPDPKSGKRKVSFDSQKSGGKGSHQTPSTKGNGGKGEKGSDAGKAGGKGSLPRATPINPVVTEVDLNLQLDLPKDARIMMDCEAAEVLQDIQQHITVLAKDAKLKMPESFNKGLEYSKIGVQYKDARSLRQLLDTLKAAGVTDGEICMIGNVCPESVEETYCLIPSLKANKHNNEDAIRKVLAGLANFRTMNDERDIYVWGLKQICYQRNDKVREAHEGRVTFGQITTIELF